MLSSASDIELWTLFEKGDKQAFGQLFRRYYPLLYQYGIKICDDPSTLEDCIQDLFTELWNKKPNQNIQSIKAYLLQALKYKLYKTFRNTKSTVDIGHANNEHFELSHETFLIMADENNEKLKQVLNALNQLPSRQKEIVYLKIYKGLTYEEISEMMGINYQVVRNLLCQALKTFRKLIVPLTLLLIVFMSKLCFVNYIQ